MATDQIDWSKYPKVKAGPNGERLEHVRMHIPHDALRTLETAALQAGRDFDAQAEYMCAVALGMRAPDSTDPLTKAQWRIVFDSIEVLSDDDEEEDDEPEDEREEVSGTC